MEFFPFLIVGFFIFVIVMIVLGAMQSAKRRKELAAWARMRGLSFSQEKNSRYDERYPEFEKLQSGDNRYAYNICDGQYNDRYVQCFDYHYETHSTDSKGRRTTHHHHFSAVILELNMPFQPIFIRPEGFFDKVGAFFGMDDIDFELDAFSRAFFVKSQNKRFAFDVIQPKTMELMLASPRFSMDFDRDEVLIYKGGKMKPSEYEAAIELVEGILANIPAYLVKEWKAQGHAAV